LVANVPFHPQEYHQCGPASLAGVLNFLGDPATPEEIASAVFRPDLRGSVSLDLALFPRSRGLATRFYRGAPADLLAAVDAGLPLVLMLDQGFAGVRVYHFAVLIGYRPEGVILNSGRSQGLLTPWASFLAQWAGAGNWTLEVSRP
jgi:ABC-type bacteriocin/lantibiotic exporter with double-glycine peptidase domain